MHLLTLTSRVELGPRDTVEPGEYIVEDISGAQLLVLADGGTLRPLEQRGLQFPNDGVHLVDTDPEGFAGKRVLIMRIGGFGDLLLMTPLLREIKRRWPTCHLAVCCMWHYSAVLENLPFIDDVIQYPCPLAVAQTYEVWQFFENAIERNPRAKEIHASELFCELAGVTEIADLKPAYHLKPSEALWANATFPRVNGTRRLVLHAKTSALCRNYPIQHYGAICGELIRKGWEILIVGAQNDVNLKGKATDGLRNLCDAGLSFRQSVSVLATADCVLGSDSAMVHAAGALGIPCVALYAPFPWRLRTKYSPTTFALQGDLPCAPCWHHANVSRGNHLPDHCPSRQHGFCGALADIKPERVIAKIEQIARRHEQAGEMVAFPGA